MNSLTMRCLRAYNRAENTFTLSTQTLFFMYINYMDRSQRVVDLCIMQYAPSYALLRAL